MISLIGKRKTGSGLREVQLAAERHNTTTEHRPGSKPGPATTDGPHARPQSSEESTAPEVARNRDSLFPFRPDSYFYYLTGFAEPEAVVALLASGDGDRHILPHPFYFLRVPQRERVVVAVCDDDRVRLERIQIVARPLLREVLAGA